jgi:hypothetical protein
MKRNVQRHTDPPPTLTHSHEQARAEQSRETDRQTDRQDNTREEEEWIEQIEVQEKMPLSMHILSFQQVICIIIFTQQQNGM